MFLLLHLTNRLQHFLGKQKLPYSTALELILLRISQGNFTLHSFLSTLIGGSNFSNISVA